MSNKRLGKKGKFQFTKQHLLAGIAVAIVLGIVVWLCNVLSGESDNPVDWARDMPRTSIASMELSFKEVEGYPSGVSVTMTEEMVDELYDIIHHLKRDEFVRGSVSDYESAIWIRCYNAEFLLEYKDGAVGLSFDEESGAIYGGGRDWKIVSDDLNAFFEKYKAIYFEQLGITQEE